MKNKSTNQITADICAVAVQLALPVVVGCWYAGVPENVGLGIFIGQTVCLIIYAFHGTNKLIDSWNTTTKYRTVRLVWGLLAIGVCIAILIGFWPGFR